MTDTALAPITVTNDQMDLVRRTIAQGASDDELRLFMYDCQRQGVHPLDKLLHFTKRKGKYTPITSIDLMRTRAAETGEMAGSDEPVYGSDEDEKWAKVTVYRLTQGQKFPYTGTAYWSEYFPGDGPEGFMWQKMPRTMLGKCAEALALRKAFPKQLAGVYVKEEMDQADRDAPTPGATGKAPRLVSAKLSDERPTAPASGDQLFPGPDDERNALIIDGTRLTEKLRFKQSQKEEFLETYIGRNADVLTCDVAALTDMINALRKRAGEKRWGE